MSIADRWVGRLLYKAGVDRAVAFTLLWRVWNAVAGPATLFLVALYLTPEEQGFYFTFASLIAMRVFFELGFGTVALQFASHEKAQLEWNSEGLLEGDFRSKQRLASLVRLILKCYGFVAFAFFLVALPAGFLFFSTQRYPAVDWRFPWVVLVAATSFLIPVTPLLSVLEGCGLVPEVARMRWFDAFLSNIACWVALLFHRGLMSPAILTCVSAVWQVGWMLSFSRRKWLRDMLAMKRSDNRIGWKGEIWPFQWRIALSWVSGYLIFQLFSPVIFRYWGPVAAGRMGLSVTMCSGILTVGIAWVNTKAPLFGMLVAQRRFDELDLVYFPSLRRSVAIVMAANCFIFSAVLFLGYTHNRLSARVLDPLSLAFLMGATATNVFVFAQSVYLRAHKQEPYLALSLVVGICTMLSTLVLGKFYGPQAVCAGYFAITLGIAGLWGYRIFQAKRREWHADAADSSAGVTQVTEVSVG